MSANAAEDLEGHVLPGGWTVLDRIYPRPGDTGGNFSVNYWVEDQDGRRGFCKVLNFWWLFNSHVAGTDPIEAISSATRVYQFERDLARECVDLSKVVTALHDGSFNREGFSLSLVSFIIFEVADDGDIRKVLDNSSYIDFTVRLRAVHNIAAGLQQLHGREVAHQDVKPSNTLMFSPDAHGRRLAKIGDLGRATVVGRPIDHDDFPIAGDPAYAPPEGLYGDVPSGFGPRRAACDLYQLGSLLCFVFTGAGFNAYLHQELHPSHNWHNWTGSYSEVLPYVTDAYSRALESTADQVPLEIRHRVLELMRALCHPDPLLRGHPRAQKGIGNPYSLDRVVTELNLLCHHAAVYLRAVS